MANDLKEFLTTLKEKTNIIEVASQYISLDRKGGTYWACCPFHHEKTPSFAINEADGFYHCFGCGESGDVIKFVQGMENIEFMDAVKILAERVKLPIPQTNFDGAKTAEQKRKRDAVLKILNDAAHFYLNNLHSGKAGEHVNYILKRRISAEAVRRFGMGASLNFNDLPNYLLSRGHQRQDLIDSGAVNEVNGRLTDAQGGRLIIPIINAMDEVIAFGGRALQKTDFAKYKNTKETLVFNKSKTLYNINLLKKLRKQQTINEIIIVEGYMDTVSVYQAGFKNVVASMGTSLTQEQARILKRYTDNVLISYDGDSAGQKANMRGLEILKSAGLNVKVVPLPEGLDPDDVIKQHGAEGYKKCLNSAMPFIDFKLHALKSAYDLTKSEDKRAYVAEALKIIKTADSAAVSEDLLKSLRAETGYTYESLLRDLNNSPVEKKKEAESVPLRNDTASALVKASRFVIAAALFKARFSNPQTVMEIPYRSDVHDVIARYIFGQFIAGERVHTGDLFEFFEDDTEEYGELNKILDYCDGDKFNGAVAEKYYFDCIKALRLAETDEKIAEIKRKIESETEISVRKELASELQKLIGQMKKIKSGESI